MKTLFTDNEIVHSYEEVAALPKSYIQSVELNDAASEVVGDLWNDTIHHRVLSREGALKADDVVKAIRSIGFDGFWSVEILSREHRMLPSKEQAKRSFEAASALFR